MPVYEIKVPGAPGPRMVKAKDVGVALGGIVEIKAIGAERMLELQDAGVKLEKVEDPDPADPANYAPGGPLHGKTKPAAVITAEEEEARQSGAGGKDEGGGTGKPVKEAGKEG